MRLMGKWNWWAPGFLARFVDRLGFSHVEDDESAELPVRAARHRRRVSPGPRGERARSPRPGRRCAARSGEGAHELGARARSAQHDRFEMVPTKRNHLGGEGRSTSPPTRSAWPKPSGSVIVGGHAAEAADTTRRRQAGTRRYRSVMRLILDSDLQPDTIGRLRALSADLDVVDLRDDPATDARTLVDPEVEVLVGRAPPTDLAAGPVAALAPGPIGRGRPPRRRSAVAEGPARDERARRLRRPDRRVRDRHAPARPPARRLGGRPGGSSLARRTARSDAGPRPDGRHRRLRLDRSRGRPPAVGDRHADHRGQATARDPRTTTPTGCRARATPTARSRSGSSASTASPTRPPRPTWSS